jgi:hypothetical protein
MSNFFYTKDSFSIFIKFNKMHFYKELAEILALLGIQEKVKEFE